MFHQMHFEYAPIAAVDAFEPRTFGVGVGYVLHTIHLADAWILAQETFVRSVCVIGRRRIDEHIWMRRFVPL